MDAQEAKALEDIDKYGCHVLKVFDEKGTEPDFAYSVGIFGKFKKPELVIIGLNLDSAHEIINDYCERIKNGEEFIPGRFYSEFLSNDYDVCFVKVSEKYYHEYFGWNQWYYKGSPYEVLQFIFPTKDKKWPWSKPKPEVFTWLPILTDSGQASKPS
jgi:hypothetical protein